MKHTLVIGTFVVLLDTLLKWVSRQWTTPNIAFRGQWVFGLGHLESNYFVGTYLVHPAIRLLGGALILAAVALMAVRIKPGRIAMSGLALMSLAALGNGGELAMRGFVTDYLVWGTLTAPMVANLSDGLGVLGCGIVMLGLADEIAADMRTVTGAAKPKARTKRAQG